MLSLTLKKQNEQPLYVSSSYGSTIESIIDKINQSRSTEIQICKLYNPLGQEIPKALWKIQIKENMTLHLDDSS